MGRYLRLGIATSLCVRKKKNRWGGISDLSLHDNKEKIEKELSTYLDLTKYNFEEKEECFIYRLKPGHFNDNIHDLIKEMYPLLDCTYDMIENAQQNSFAIDENFNQEHFPLKIAQYKESDNRHDAGDFYASWNEVEEEWAYDDEYWLFEDDEFRENISLNIYYINMWCDWNKIDGEDDTIIVRLLNNLSRGRFNNPLFKNALFYIC